VARLISRALAVIAALTLSGDFAFAQDKADFSGSWILASGSSDSAVPQALSIQQPLVRTNRRGEPVPPYFFDITIARTLATGTTSETFWIGVEGGFVPGSVTSGANLAKTHWRAFWDEQSLVIEKDGYTGPVQQTGDWSERREVFSLTQNGELRVEMTLRGSHAETVTVALVYRRS
jgi:hypothetical protein